MFAVKKSELSYGRGYVYSLQYHLVWCTKYRKKVLKDGIDLECKKMLQDLAEEYRFQILAMEVMPDHIHMLVKIPPKYSIAEIVGYLKGKSSLMLDEKFPELKYKYRNREFWCRGYYVDTAGKNAQKIAEYIGHQLEEDQAGEQLTMGNF